MDMPLPPSDQSTTSDPLLSVVVPVFNEAGGIGALLARLLPVLESIGSRWEIVFVNDGSTDASMEVLIGTSAAEPRIKAIELSRNFGKEIALTAGLDYASGDVVIPMDADLQHPPELIPEMVQRWQQGYDIVTAVHRRRTDEGAARRLLAWVFYRIMAGLSRTPIPDGAGDFRLLSRRAVDALKRLPERTRFMKGLVAWVGFKQSVVQFDRAARQLGVTRWSIWRLWNFALDGLFAFSSAPLKVWGYVGFAIALPALLYAIYLIARTLVLGVDIPGYASLIVGMLFLGGIQLISLGVMGEYLARVYDEVKERPLYLVRSLHGFGDSDYRC